jgi:hypothetical protein
MAMLKLITLLKRKAGMSREDFIAYYESNHRVIGEKYLRAHACRYVRRYLQPLPHPITGETIEPDHDVLMEIWFPDEAAFKATMDVLTAPAAAAEIAADEEKMFDREKMRMFTVQEFESQLDAGKP